MATKISHNYWVVELMISTMRKYTPTSTIANKKVTPINTNNPLICAALLI
jgi:hypothetical protein